MSQADSANNTSLTLNCQLHWHTSDWNPRCIFFRAYLGIPILKALALPCIEKSMLYKLQKVTFIIVNAK